MKPVVCLVGPSGVGKTSYARRLMVERRFFGCRVYTTRAPRRDDPEHIVYVDDRFFRTIHDWGALLECDIYNGYWYGTCRTHFDRLHYDERVVGLVLDLTPNGCRQVLRSVPSAQIIALVPDDPEWLRVRISERGTESHEVVEARMRLLEEYLSEIRTLPAHTLVCCEPRETWPATFEALCQLIARD